MAESCCNAEVLSTRDSNITSPVNFPTRSRIHIAINVRLSVYDVAPFYSALFGAKATTLVEKYAKFELDEPPINLTINEFADNARGEAVFGIQLKDKRLLAGAQARLERSRIAVHEHDSGIWAKDPDGNRWELFVDTPHRSALL